VIRRFCHLVALALLMSSPTQAEIIWNNGTFSTSGVALSIGWNQTANPNFRFALTDDLFLTSPAVLSKLTIHGFMTGNTVNQPQIISAFVRILADSSGAPGGQLLGDLATPLPFTETFTGAFFSSGSTRPIYRVEIQLPNWKLCPGTYWIQFNVDQNDIRPDTGTPNGNYFSSLVASPPPEANGYHYSVLADQYFTLDNPDTGQGNAPPFVVEGTLLPTCSPIGDFNNDGDVTLDDTPMFVGTLLAGDFNGCADANSDCQIDGRDVSAFVSEILP
jgi:hypothetical protein